MYMEVPVEWFHSLSSCSFHDPQTRTARSLHHPLSLTVGTSGIDGCYLALLPVISESLSHGKTP